MSKFEPQISHPCPYKRINKLNNEIVYIPVTHDNPAKLKTGQKITTISLNENLNKKEFGTSYAFPTAYKGIRSDLGRERKDLKLSKKGWTKVENLFNSLPIVNITNKHRKKT